MTTSLQPTNIGVLMLTIPVAEEAKPRKVITNTADVREAVTAGSVAD